MVNPKVLPSAVTGEDKSQQYCDTCYKKGKGYIAAVSYCTDDSCRKRYCDKHKQVGSILAWLREAVVLLWSCPTSVKGCIADGGKLLSKTMACCEQSSSTH